MLSLQHITYRHPDKDVLFDDLDLVINSHDKIALVGNNGLGKSTLLKILAGKLQPAHGSVKTSSAPYYVPQHFGQFDDCTVAQALEIEDRLDALKRILGGEVTEANLALLDDDWSIEERCAEALAYWQLDIPDLSRKMGSLSGGQKTKVFLAGILIHRPRIVLLDEPGNHLDLQGRELLYGYIRSAADTLVVVSHDRTLLNLLDTVYELSRKGITVYGGNYDFYVEQKAIEAQALNEELKDKEKALRKAKETERASLERQQKLDARGRKKQEKAGLPTISLNTFKNNAEKSTARMKEAHAGKVQAMAQELDQVRKELPDKDKMKIGFGDTALHTGKILISARDINYRYGDRELWPEPLSFEIRSGARMAIKGANGSGKTTLIRIILGALEPSSGVVQRSEMKALYIDQDYSLIDGKCSVYEQAQHFNTGHWQEHEVKSRLTHFLFTQESWGKPCAALSGGEKMRLMLCCLTIGNRAPDLIILDEPTNNLDIQNMEILTAAVQDYKGTLIVVSHDVYFLEQLQVEEVIGL